jgi:hypothetical protein
MEAYIQSKMNSLMKKARDAYEYDSEDGEVMTTFSRKCEWSYREFATLLAKRCEEVRDALDAAHGGMGMNRYTPKGDKDADGHLLDWKVSIEWSKIYDNPFDDLYEEEDEEEYHGYVFEKGTVSHNTQCSCDKWMMNDGKGGHYCDCGDAPLKE